MTFCVGSSMVFYTIGLVSFSQHFQVFQIFLNILRVKNKAFLLFLLSCQSELSSMQLYPTGFAQQKSLATAKFPRTNTDQRHYIPHHYTRTQFKQAQDPLLLSPLCLSPCIQLPLLHNSKSKFPFHKYLAFILCKVDEK